MMESVLTLITKPTEQELAYYYLLEYFNQVDPKPHFRGVRMADGHIVDYWPHLVQAIEDGRLMPEAGELAA